MPKSATVDPKFDWQRRIVAGPDGLPSTFYDYTPRSSFGKDPHDPWDQNPIKPDKDVEMHAGLGEVVRTVDVMTVRPAINCEISRVEVAGGYRWLKGPSPSISVPGLPNVIKSNSDIGKIHPDAQLKGTVDSIDYVGTSLLSASVSPLEPVFHSLISPDGLDRLDVIVTRSVLMKLYALAGVNKIEEHENDGTYPFRIDGELIGGTVVLHRWESVGDRWTSHPKPSTSKSYHRAATIDTTPEADVNAGCEATCAFEVGAVVRWPEQVDMGSEDGVGGGDDISGASSGDGADSTKFGPTQRVPMPRAGLHNLEAVPSGYDHPAQADLAIIKTRSLGTPSKPKELDYNHIYGQLFFGQIPHAIIGRHKNYDYSVEPQRVLRVDDEVFAKARAETQTPVNRVAWLLRFMVAQVRDNAGENGSGTGQLAFIAPRAGKIVVMQKMEMEVELSDFARELLEGAYVREM